MGQEAKSDAQRNGEAACAVATLLVCFGTGLFACCAVFHSTENDYQHQAVLRGFAEYAVDADGSPRWRWKHLAEVRQPLKVELEK